MKKLIVLVLIYPLYAWAIFGLELPTEDLMVDGKEVHITNSDRKTKFSFSDSYKIFPRDDGYKQGMHKRLTSMFNFISSYGKERGYQSFMIMADGINSIPFNSAYDIADYCTLGVTFDIPTQYTAYQRYCGKQILAEGDFRIIMDVTYFPDNTGAFNIASILKETEKSKPNVTKVEEKKFLNLF